MLELVEQVQALEAPQSDYLKGIFDKTTEDVARKELNLQRIVGLRDALQKRDEPAITALDWFLERTISHRDQLVLPLHGGPVSLSATSRDLQVEIRRTLQGIPVICRGP